MPTAHGKADLTLYREAGAQVIGILSTLSICERASIDEAYIDVTDEANRRHAAGGGWPAAPFNTEGWHVCGVVSTLKSCRCSFVCWLFDMARGRRFSNRM